MIIPRAAARGECTREKLIITRECKSCRLPAEEMEALRDLQGSTIYCDGPNNAWKYVVYNIPT